MFSDIAFDFSAFLESPRKVQEEITAEDTPQKKKKKVAAAEVLDTPKKTIEGEEGEEVTGPSSGILLIFLFSPDPGGSAPQAHRNSDCRPPASPVVIYTYIYIYMSSL